MNTYIAFLRGINVAGHGSVKMKDLIERFASLMKNLEVFSLSHKVKGKYGFPNNFVEKELGVLATTRNWKTINRIIGL